MISDMGARFVRARCESSGLLGPCFKTGGTVSPFATEGYIRQPFFSLLSSLLLPSGGSKGIATPSHQTTTTAGSIRSFFCFFHRSRRDPIFDSFNPCRASFEPKGQPFFLWFCFPILSRYSRRRCETGLTSVGKWNVSPSLLSPWKSTGPDILFTEPCIVLGLVKPESSMERRGPLR